ncbi:MAG: nuclear transport factor 2 family protein [Acidobacteriota bacterium]
MDRDAAEAFAEEWIAAWNSHDLERVLSHYADEFEMWSPLIASRWNESRGVLRGKDAIRPYWKQGLSSFASNQPLHFTLRGVRIGVQSITIEYRNAAEIDVAEVLFFDGQGQIIRGVAHYS